jgi:hypothetical protein
MALLQNWKCVAAAGLSDEKIQTGAQMAEVVVPPEDGLVVSTLACKNCGTSWTVTEMDTGGIASHDPYLCTTCGLDQVFEVDRTSRSTQTRLEEVSSHA